MTFPHGTITPGIGWNYDSNTDTIRFEDVGTYTFTPNNDFGVYYNVVGGGGSGHDSVIMYNEIGNGGGGGETKYGNILITRTNNYTITVGNGGLSMSDGESSTFSGITASGGKMGEDINGGNGGGSGGGRGGYLDMVNVITILNGSDGTNGGGGGGGVGFFLITGGIGGIGGNGYKNLYGRGGDAKSGINGIPNTGNGGGGGGDTLLNYLGGSGGSGVVILTLYPSTSPTIASINPTTGLTIGGTNVIITGTNFIGTTSVTFGGISVSNFNIVSSTQITCQTPQVPSVQTVDVIVNNLVGQDTLVNGFDYTLPPAPIVNLIDPSSCSTLGGKIITIKGSNFTGITNVQFGTVDGSIDSINDTTIVCRTPSQTTTGIVDIILISPYYSITKSNAFNYTTPQPPTIVSVIYTTSPSVFIQNLTITGTNLLSTTDVTINGTSVIFTTTNDNEIISSIQTHIIITFISVTTTYGQYTYYSPAAVFYISPSSGLITGGEQVVIAGINFTGTTDVKFGANSCTSFIIDSDNQITCITPVGTLGITNISIIQSTSNINTFNSIYTYTAPVVPVVPISTVCFPATTPIKTDQGIICIEKINPKNNTIRSKPIITITKTVTNDKYLVCFEKNALDNELPSQETIMSQTHCIFYKGKMRNAKWFLYKFEGVKKVKYQGEILYNILLDTHDKMVVNNLICETLNPNNQIAHLYKTLPLFSNEMQNKMIYMFNELNEENKKIVSKR